MKGRGWGGGGGAVQPEAKLTRPGLIYEPRENNKSFNNSFQLLHVLLKVGLMNLIIFLGMKSSLANSTIIISLALSGTFGEFILGSVQVGHKCNRNSRRFQTYLTP